MQGSIKRSGSGATRKVADMLNFPWKEVGKQGKRNRKEGKEKKETQERMERKGKDQGEKGNGIYLGSMLRKKERACK